MREIQTFSWRANANANGTSKFDVLVANFGDGYEQSAENGINTESESWPLSFTGTESYIQEILDFLRSHKSVYPFFWRPPMGTLALFKAGDVARKPIGGGAYELSVTFTQKYKP